MKTLKFASCLSLVIFGFSGFSLAQDASTPDSSIYMSCENDVCGEKERVLSVKVGKNGVKNRVAKVARSESRNVDFQKSQLKKLQKTTGKSLSRAERHIIEGEGRKMMNVVLHLEEQEFDFTRLRNLRGDKDKRNFKSVISERRAQLSVGQERVKKQISALGGKVNSQMFLSNVMVVSVPAESVETLSKIQSVVAVEEDGRTKPDADGIERRNAMGIPSGGMSGLNGGQGSTESNGNEVLFGVIESNNALNTSHVSFLDWTGGPSNILDTDTCSSSSCSGSSTTTANTHGTNVTSVILGSIEQGQNSSITDTNSRRRRSGIAIEGHANYYNDGGFLSGVAEAIETSVADGVDVINMSLSPNGNYCSNESLSGIQSAARAANDAGVMMIVSAGNDADDLPAGTCTVNSIGALPDTITVGATNDVSNLSSMNSVALAGYSGRGTVNISLDGGRTVSSRMVDLIVTGDVDLVAGSGSIGSANNTGTSFSAPQVAGVAGLLKDWANDRGGLNSMETDPYALRTLLAVMGDGVSSVSGGGSGYGYTVSDHSGFGHLRFVNLDTELGSGGAWGLHRRYLSEGSVFEWSVGSSGAESSSVLGWKFAATWDWNSYGGSPDIRFDLVDKCPSGGGETIIRTAARHPLKARIRLRGSEMASKFHGRCMYMRATVEDSSGTVPLYAADYYYTSARSNHDMP